MSDDFSIGFGRIERGISANAFIEAVLAFVRDESKNWRERVDRGSDTSEEHLNSQLCKHLNNAAHRGGLPFSFHHEERQGYRRRIDMSAGFVLDRFLGDTYYSESDPFLVFECKRLPPPGRAREREYVTSGADDKILGGMQRFKLGLHAGRHRCAAMIGYIQRESPAWWLAKINTWIADLDGVIDRHGEPWSKTEALDDFGYHDAGIAIARSRHPRIGQIVSHTIELHHIWIVMTSE